MARKVVNTKFWKIFGNRLREARVLAGLTQIELADRLGCSWQQVAKYEQGINKADFETILRICDLLGKNITFFINGDGDQPLARGHSHEVVIVKRYQAIKSEKRRRIALDILNLLGQDDA